MNRPGLLINGQPTDVHFIDVADLKESPYLEGYRDVVNAAFSHGHPPYIPASFVRLTKSEQILEELGPGSFSFIVTQRNAGGEKVIASGSATPAPDHSSSEILYSDAVAQTTVTRSNKARIPIPGVTDWELKHVCTSPAFMKQGLANHILDLLDREVQRRSLTHKQSSSGDTRNGAQKINSIRLMITTIKELNGLWYQKKGYRMVEFSSYPAGTLDGTAPFSIWHMDRLIPT